jgi:hypothetical protein
MSLELKLREKVISSKTYYFFHNSKNRKKAGICTSDVIFAGRKYLWQFRPDPRPYPVPITSPTSPTWEERGETETILERFRDFPCRHTCCRYCRRS